MNPLFHIKRIIKQRKFWRPQTYTVRITVSIPASITTGYTLLAPPQHTTYQQYNNVTLSPIVQPTIHTIGSNQCYVIANDLLKESRDISFECTVAVQPRRTQHAIHPTIKKIYNYTVRNLTYGNPIRGLYSNEEALKKKCVDCGGFSSVLQSLLKKEGIHSRIVAGFWAGYDRSTMHAWLEYEHAPNEWIPLDASTDFLQQRGRTYKTGGCGYVGSDRVVVSVGSYHTFEFDSISSTIDILQTPIVIEPNKKIQFIDQYSISIKPL